MGNLLPIPDPSIPLGKVLAFRLKYKDERDRLILAVRRLIADLESHTAEAADVLDTVRLEIQTALNDMERTARSARLDMVRRSVAATFAIGASAAAVYKPGLSWILGLVSGYAVNIASTKSSTPWTNSPYAFLHSVKRAR